MLLVLSLAADVDWFVKEKVAHHFWKVAAHLRKVGHHFREVAGTFWKVVPHRRKVVLHFCEVTPNFPKVERHRREVVANFSGVESHLEKVGVVFSFHGKIKAACRTGVFGVAPPFLRLKTRHKRWRVRWRVSFHRALAV